MTIAPAALALAILLATAPARAEDPRDAPLAAAARRYFDSENLYNGLYLAVGGSNAGVGALLATRADPGLRAAGYPLIAVGGIEVIVGAVYLGLTPAWRREAFAELARGRAEFLAKQRDRLGGIERGFRYYELTDGAAALTGLAIGIGGAVKDNDTLAGVGAGLGAVAFAQLTMDLITHEVAKRYLAYMPQSQRGRVAAAIIKVPVSIRSGIIV